MEKALSLAFEALLSPSKADEASAVALDRERGELAVGYRPGEQPENSANSMRDHGDGDVHGGDVDWHAPFPSLCRHHNPHRRSTACLDAHYGSW